MLLKMLYRTEKACHTVQQRLVRRHTGKEEMVGLPEDHPISRLPIRNEKIAYQNPKCLLLLFMLPGLAHYTSDDEAPPTLATPEVEKPSPFKVRSNAQVNETQPPTGEKATTKRKRKKQEKASLPQPRLAGQDLPTPPLIEPSDEQPTKRQRVSPQASSLLPPQVRHKRQNICTEDLGKYYSERTLKERALLTKQSPKGPRTTSVLESE